VEIKTNMVNHMLCN